MSLELARQDIVAAIEAAKVGAPVANLIIEYDNRIMVNTETATDPFLAVRILNLDAYQVDLSPNALHRFEGQIHLAAAVKAGSGAGEANALLDFFYPQLQRKQFGSVRTLMAKTARPTPHLGWLYHPVLIPFWFDRVT